MILRLAELKPKLIEEKLISEKDYIKFEQDMIDFFADQRYNNITVIPDQYHILAYKNHSQKDIK